MKTTRKAMVLTMAMAMAALTACSGAAPGEGGDETPGGSAPQLNAVHPGMQLAHAPIAIDDAAFVAAKERTQVSTVTPAADGGLRVMGTHAGVAFDLTIPGAETSAASPSRFHVEEENGACPGLRLWILMSWEDGQMVQFIWAVDAAVAAGC